MAKRKKWISAILLGAGESRRMGRDKLMLPWAGKTVFEHCLDILLRSETMEIVVVLRSPSQELEGRIARYPGPAKRKIKVVVNPDSREGMSSSIRIGLRSIQPMSRGVLIALGDQPLLKARTINALIRAFSQGKRKIVVPFYRKKRGNPVVFDREYVRCLMGMQGDTGGRSILENYPEEIFRFRTGSEGVIRDIDTRRQYRALKARESKPKAMRR